uniref:Uncharacterized protein n=1 Tax=Anguilla anguilla TaxID=7936 RepID=A0A0E9PCD9_ANGAN
MRLYKFPVQYSALCQART